MASYNRQAAVVMCGAAVLWVFASALGSASPFSKTTFLKFSGAVALPGTTLTAGEYVFELANPNGGRNVVQVMNKNRTKLHFLGLTRGVVRPAGAVEGAMVTLGEAPPGTPRPIKVWFPDGDSVGHEFLYK